MVKAGAVHGPNCKAGWGPCSMMWMFKAYEGPDCGCVGSGPVAVHRSRWVLVYALVDPGGSMWVCMCPCLSLYVCVYFPHFVCVTLVVFWRFCLNYSFKFGVGHILLAGEHPLLFYSILSTNNKGAMCMCDNGVR